MAARGVRFTQAYVPSPLCTPSRAALAAGREYDESQVPGLMSDFPIDEVPTFYQLLNQAGYHVMTVGKDDLTKGTLLGYTEDYAGCNDCVRGDGRYHQADLGFDDGFRFVDKVQQFDVGTDTYLDALGAYLYNQTVVLPNNSVTNAFEVLYACYEDQIRSQLCNSETYTRENQEDVVTTKMAIELLQRRPRDKPFFLQVLYLSPHDPHLVTAEMQAAVSGKIWPDPVDGTPGLAPGGAVTANGEPNATFGRANYAAMLQNNDALFQKVVDEITFQGEYENTIVIVSSDHGEILGDHGQTGKETPHQSSVAVPLIIAGPNVPSAVTIDTPVANLDIAGTILDLAGITQDGMTTQSLRPLWDSTSNSSYREFASSGLEAWRMVVKEIDGISYKYVRCICASDCLSKSEMNCANIDNSTEFGHVLVDVKADPFDLVNLADERPNVVASLCSLLPATSYKGDWTTNCPKMAEAASSTSSSTTSSYLPIFWLVPVVAAILLVVGIVAMWHCSRKKTSLSASQDSSADDCQSAPV